MSDTASSPGTMRGLAIRAYGEEMVLMDDVPVPTPGPHDILMQMRSAEVGDWDELVRTGAWDMLELVLTRHVRGKVVLRIT